MRLSRTHLLWLLVGVVSLAAGNAFAFVLPTDAILSSVAKRRAQLVFKSLALHGRYKSGDEPERDVYEVVTRKARRREIKTNDSTIVELVRGSSRWLYRSGEPQPKPERITLPHLLDVFLVSGNDQDAEKLLRAWDIDTKTVSLGRFEKRIAYVIGAKPWETDKPQLWVDKELMAPLRLMGKDAKGRRIEIRTLGYESAQTNEWYPQRVELLEDGKLVESVSYHRVELDPEFDPALLEAPGR